MAVGCVVRRGRVPVSVLISAGSAGCRSVLVAIRRAVVLVWLVAVISSLRSPAALAKRVAQPEARSG